MKNFISTIIFTFVFLFSSFDLYADNEEKIFLQVAERAKLFNEIVEYGEPNDLLEMFAFDSKQPSDVTIEVVHKDEDNIFFFKTSNDNHNDLAFSIINCDPKHVRYPLHKTNEISFINFKSTNDLNKNNLLISRYVEYNDICPKPFSSTVLTSHKLFCTM
jgi:hypothetical protein